VRHDPAMRGDNSAIGNDTSAIGYIITHTGRLTAGERREAARVRRTIRDHGWALASGCVEVAGRHVDMRYTVGLTRHHGHPEFAVLGTPQPGERAFLDALARQVSEGMVFEPSWVDFGSQRWAMVEVDVPEALWLAHIVYGRQGHPLRALQLVAPDRRGYWPWDYAGDSRSSGDDLLLGEWPFA